MWEPWNEAAEKTVHDDFNRLWGTNFLENLWIQKDREYVFSNGVVGELITYNMEERQRVKIVDYVGSKKIEASKIDEKLKDANAEIRLDTFIDPALVRKVAGIVRDMLKEKGFQNAEVTPEIQAMPGGPKLVHLTFHMTEGPKVKIRKIIFTGNKVMSSRTLKKKMKDNKEMWFLSFINGRGTFQETKFDEDADKISAYYKEHGYIRANVGTPEQKYLQDSKDKKTRWIELRVPITEGARYKVGDVEFAGNTVVKTDFLKPLFKLKEGEYYNEKDLRKGLERAREVYGHSGYWEFTGFPDYKFRDDPAPGQEVPDALAAPLPAIVDVTMRLQEGTQYFVNRITFVGNTTTHDTVIRREMSLLEGYTFDTEALKYSVKRLNQLGYFKPLEEGKGVDVKKMPNETNKVDVRLKLEEQNRNQMTFGAGVSQFEGFFGQLSFQTSNFLGRGESLTLSLQAGSRAQNYSLAFTEPFLFDRNITGGLQIFKQEIHYLNQFTQVTTGGTVTFGLPIGHGFTRFFTNYSYQRVHVSDINSIYTDPTVLRRNPFLQDSLLIGQGGERTISKITPSLVHNTVDNPIFPTSGARYTFSTELAGLGGNTSFYKPTLEGRVLLEAEPADEPRHAREPRVHPPVRGQPVAADLREAVPGRRVQHARLRHPQHRAARSGHRPRARRQQEPAVQRRAGVRHRRAGARDSVLRRRPGARPGAELRVARGHHTAGAAAGAAARRSRAPLQLVDPEPRPAVRHHRPAQRLQDVDGRRGPVLHARAQRAVPVDFLLRSAAGRRPRQLAAAAAAVRVPFRGGFDFLVQGMLTMHRFRTPKVLLLGLAILAMTACSDNTLSQLAAASQTTVPPSTDVFTGTLSKNGAFTHIFTTSTLGAVTVTIINLAPDTSQIVGLSLGVWNGTACSTSPATGGSASDVATSGSTITLNATAAGNLCARLYDVGFITTPVLYTLQITHP